MGEGGWLAGALTVALRSNSAEELAAALALQLRRIERSAPKPLRRDLAIADLAPFADCARRIGLDPVVLFDQAATTAQPDLADLIREIARWEDVSLAAFGWALTDAPAGPEYTRAF